jgi:hypothetical protein
LPDNFVRRCQSDNATPNNDCVKSVHAEVANLREAASCGVSASRYGQMQGSSLVKSLFDFTLIRQVDAVGGV